MLTISKIAFLKLSTANIIEEIAIISKYNNILLLYTQAVNITKNVLIKIDIIIIICLLLSPINIPLNITLFLCILNFLVTKYIIKLNNNIIPKNIGNTQATLLNS